VPQQGQVFLSLEALKKKTQKMPSATDVRLSTLDRYAHALGYRVEYSLVPETLA
jgi:hypothetical protein